MRVRLSVIVPVHNVRPYLARCLDSILSQTYQAMDIVLVDDGSTDGSGDICDSYAQRDKRIQVMHQANRGVVNARNTGLRQARAEAPFVTFVDSDDWLEPDTYASMMEVIEREQVVCVLAGHYEDTGSTQRTCLEGMAAGRYDRERMQREFLPQMMGKEPFFTWGIFPSLCNKIFAKRIIVPIMLAEDEHIRMAEDAAAVFLALSCGEPVYVMGKCFYHYVQKRSSSVKMIPPRARERSEYAALQTFMVQHLRTELRGGWTRHALFVMVQRADALYRGWSNLPYLFPFPQVAKGSKIILYGAGTYGQRLYQALQSTGFMQVVGWSDRNALALRELGLPVDPPEAIGSMPAEDIVVAISIGNARLGAQQDLQRRYPDKRVHVWDTELIFSTETQRAFGLL